MFCRCWRAKSSRRGQTDAAAELYELGAEKVPARRAVASGAGEGLSESRARIKKLFDVLARLADRDADDLAMRKKLAQLALAPKGFSRGRPLGQPSAVDRRDGCRKRTGCLAEALVGRAGLSRGR